MSTTTIEEHVNSEGETIRVDLIEDGRFKGQELLVVPDDPPPHGTGVEALMLLDESTKD